MYIGFWWGYLKERDYLKDLGVNGRMILKWILNKWELEGVVGWMWLRRGSSGELL
jgi:hypothetical protein